MLHIYISIHSTTNVITSASVNAATDEGKKTGKIFSNFLHFSPSFQIFCPCFCTFSEKSHACPYFVEQTLYIYVCIFYIYIYIYVKHFFRFIRGTMGTNIDHLFKM